MKQIQFNCKAALQKIVIMQLTLVQCSFSSVPNNVDAAELVSLPSSIQFKFSPHLIVSVQWNW